MRFVQGPGIRSYPYYSDVNIQIHLNGSYSITKIKSFKLSKV